MDAQSLLRLKTRLQKRRHEILRSRQAAERGVTEVREGRTDPEYEESAQADHVEYTLEKVSSSQQRELAQIDLALARMDAGTYGYCAVCGLEIPIERLEALPYAQSDTDCATRQEDQFVGVMRAPTL